MGTEGGRAFKFRWILERVKTASSQGFTVDEEKLIAEFCVSLGSSRRTCMEILSHLHNASEIVRFDKKILTKKAYEADQILKKAERETEIPTVKVE